MLGFLFRVLVRSLLGVLVSCLSSVMVSYFAFDGELCIECVVVVAVVQ